MDSKICLTSLGIVQSLSSTRKVHKPIKNQVRITIQKKISTTRYTTQSKSNKKLVAKDKHIEQLAINSLIRHPSHGLNLRYLFHIENERE